MNGPINIGIITDNSGITNLKITLSIPKIIPYITWLSFKVGVLIYSLKVNVPKKRILPHTSSNKGNHIILLNNP